MRRKNRQKQLANCCIFFFLLDDEKSREDLLHQSPDYLSEATMLLKKNFFSQIAQL